MFLTSHMIGRHCASHVLYNGWLTPYIFRPLTYLITIAHLKMHAFWSFRAAVSMEASHVERFLPARRNTAGFHEEMVEFLSSISSPFCNIQNRAPSIQFVFVVFLVTIGHNRTLVCPIINCGWWYIQVFEVMMRCYSEKAAIMVAST
jgi:hypothetical protein